MHEKGDRTDRGECQTSQVFEEVLGLVFQVVTTARTYFITLPFPTPAEDFRNSTQARSGVWYIAILLASMRLQYVKQSLCLFDDLV